MSTSKSTQVPPLWLARAIIATLRGTFRVQELFAPPHKREKLRDFRKKMSALEADNKEVLRRLKNDPEFGALEAMDMLLEHNKGDDETRASFEESRDHLQAIRRVSQELRDIHRDADGDWGKAADYRTYLEQHPDAGLAYSYLGGALQRAGDFDASLTAYREALRLDGSALLAASTRISIGEVLREKGDTESSTAEFYAVINDKTKGMQVFKSLAYYSLGVALADAGDRPGARKAWKQAIEWDNTRTITPKAQEKIAASR